MPTLGDEPRRHGRYSPGPVLDEEMLLRAVFTREHVDAAGQLLPAAIQRQDLVERGWSVQRRQHANYGYMLDHLAQKLTRKPETEQHLFGLARISVLDLRSETDQSGKRALVVVDAARSRRASAHAMVWLINTAMTRSEFLRVRQQIMDGIERRGFVQVADLWNEPSQVRTVTVVGVHGQRTVRVRVRATFDDRRDENRELSSLELSAHHEWQQHPANQLRIGDVVRTRFCRPIQRKSWTVDALIERAEVEPG